MPSTRPSRKHALMIAYAKQNTRCTRAYENAYFIPYRHTPRPRNRPRGVDAAHSRAVCIRLRLVKCKMCTVCTLTLCTTELKSRRMPTKGWVKKMCTLKHTHTHASVPYMGECVCGVHTTASSVGGGMSPNNCILFIYINGKVIVYECVCLCVLHVTVCVCVCVHSRV